MNPKNILSRPLRLIKKLIKFIDFSFGIIKKGGYQNINIVTTSNEDLLQEKLILITGGSTGIGNSLAKKCLGCGATVIVTGRKKSRLIEAFKEFSNSKLHCIEWDISDIDIIDKKYAEIYRIFNKHPDILVNNAGILEGSQFLNVTESSWDKVYSVNSKGLFFITQKIVKEWTRKKNRSTKKVINISSQAAFVGATYPYRLSKWDVEGFTRGLALKFINKNIIVNGIAPGIVATNMQKNLYIDDKNYYTDLNPSKRLALPEEISELALFLISDRSNFIVGHTILCDGGYSLK